MEAIRKATGEGWSDDDDEYAGYAEQRVLVERHWREIVAVAKELLRVQTLDDSEVEIIADVAAGTHGVEPEDLSRYRAGRDAPIEPTRE